MTDIHTHILPAVDDGSKDAKTSVSMLAEEYRQGIDSVVLTPHFYARNDSPSAFLAKRNSAAELLLSSDCYKKASEIGEMPKLFLGAEVLYYEGISHTDDINSLCIEGTSLLLLEMPCGEWAQRMFAEISNLYENCGITPIIAHLDRYSDDMRSVKKMLGACENLNLFIQLNAEAFLNRKTEHFAFKTLVNGYVSFLGSDCHGIGVGSGDKGKDKANMRAPNIGSALTHIEKKLKSKAENVMNGIYLNSQNLASRAKIANIPIRTPETT